MGFNCQKSSIGYNETQLYSTQLHIVIVCPVYLSPCMTGMTNAPCVGILHRKSFDDGALARKNTRVRSHASPGEQRTHANWLCYVWNAGDILYMRRIHSAFQSAWYVGGYIETALHLTDVQAIFFNHIFLNCHIKPVLCILFYNSQLWKT